MAQAEKIWQVCQSSPLWGPNRPLWVYLTCYRGMYAVQDERAREVLAAAQALVQERAVRIEGEKLRVAYLGVVPENREIVRLWQASR